MEKRMCQWQGVLLEAKLNIRISRCENHMCEFYLNPVNTKICASCPKKTPIEGDDVLTISLAADVYNAEIIERSNEVITDLFEKHCKKCSHFDGESNRCTKLECGCLSPVEDLMKSLTVHCPLELW